jgi:hypothetical protein
MDGGEDPHKGDEEKEPQVHDYKIDTLGRRYPVDVYGDRVIPNNRRPPRCTKGYMEAVERSRQAEPYRRHA